MRLQGIITAMATPKDDKENISKERVNKLVDHLINNGISGLFILGTNGEFYALNKKEKLLLAQLTVHAANGRVPIYAGIGGISTLETVILSKEMAQTGVDAFSVITPYLIKLSQSEIIKHYEIVAENSPLPIILYNIPANTQLNIEPETVAYLSKNPNIIGIKDSSGDLQKMKKYLDLVDKDSFDVLVGSDSKILKALELGASGAVAATSNVLTRTDVGIYNSYKLGDFKLANELQESINAFREILKLGNVPSVLKKSLDLINIPVGNPVLPVQSINDKEKINLIKDVLIRYRNIEGFEVK